MSKNRIIVEAGATIDYLGGTSAVARLIEAPVSTVHSWRKNGIPASRFAHLRLIAAAEGKPLPDDISELVSSGHAVGVTPPPADLSAGKDGEISPQRDAA